jgi:hypothetical protein
MRLTPHFREYPSLNQQAPFFERLVAALRSMMVPILGLTGLIHSGIPVWASLIIGLFSVLLIITNFKHGFHIPRPSIIETDDGDIVLYRKSAYIHILKIRSWGWAGRWGLKLLQTNKINKSIFLSSSHYPPAQLRRLIRDRIYRKNTAQEHTACVQVPIKPRLWL